MKSKQYKFLERFLKRVYSRAEITTQRCGNAFGGVNYGINAEMAYFKKYKRLSKGEQNV